MSPKPTRVAI